MTFMLIINWIQQPTWSWEDDHHPQSNDAASSMSLLQTKCLKHKNRRPTAGQVAHTQRPVSKLNLEALIGPPQTVHIDFSEVLFLADELRCLDCQLQQIWPSDLEAPAVTVEAFTTLTAAPQLPPLAYHFFTDGSKIANGQVGSGIVMLVQTIQGWHYGGCLYKIIESAGSSIYGEHGAIIWALFWAPHLSNKHWDSFGTTALEFSFNFDATVSGYSVAGYWRTPHALTWRTLMRSIAQILQTRHGYHSIFWNHIKAHCGHPWNECADALAKYAAAHPETAGHSRFWEQILQD
jgi:ribonuclease HI